MSKKLIVAEKPSVARDIARVLGVKGRGEGCLVGEEYVVTWAIGHLVSLCEPGETDANDRPTEDQVIKSIRVETNGVEYAAEKIQ